MPKCRQSTAVKARNTKMMLKVEGAQQTCHGISYNYGRQTIKACERSEQCNNLGGRFDSGDNTSKRSKVTQPKPDTPQRCGRQKTLRWTSLRRPVPNGRQHGPYSLTCKSTTYCGGYIVVGSFARKQGNAQDTCWKRKGETEKAQKTT